MSPEKYKLGWRRDLPDVRDFQFMASPIATMAVPDEKDLRPETCPVYDQGDIGSCTGNGIGADHYFLQLKHNRDTAFSPSRLFLYYNERDMEGTVEYDSGAAIRDGFKSLAKQGICPETMWPYDVSVFRNRPTDECYRAALDHQSIRYSRVNQNINQIKACIASGYPIVFGITIYDSFYSTETTSTGKVSLPKSSDSCVGGHCVEAIGYTKSGIIGQNSWGTEWGDKGFFYLPWDYILNPDLASDLWTLRLIEV